MTDVLIAPVAGPGRLAVDTTAAGDTLARVLAGLADGWRAWCRYRELRATSDAGLARLGLERADIARHAVLGTAGPGRPDRVVGLGRRISYEAVEHELRTPLTSMRSAAEIMLESPDLGEDDRRRFLRVLVEEGERLARTVDRLLGEPGLRRALG